MPELFRAWATAAMPTLKDKNEKKSKVKVSEGKEKRKEKKQTNIQHAAGPAF